MQRTPPPAAMDGGSVWSISPEERGKHDKQFDTLAPVLGYVSGEQARGFFLQSGLPPSVLAEIWNLADMDGDGKMDRQEFSIAMKLIKMKLQGRSLPVALPMGLKQLPVAHAPHPSSARFGMGSLPNLSVGMPPPMSAMSILTPIPANTPLRPAAPMMMLPLTAGFPRCQLHFLSPAPLMAAGLPLSGFSSPLTFSPPGSRGMSQANSLVDLGSSSSSSSSTTSLASNSPKTTAGSSDWAVPQASRLKYRQQFNTLDKLMSGYLSGAQVRNALIASNLTQTQLATIWNLADVDKDGQLRADEFILAMHLVDTAKTGRPLPLTLPQDLIPPPLRGGLKCGELVNGTGPYSSPSLIDSLEIEPILKNKSSVSFEDKLKENFVRGSAELERRRQALEEQQRKERERRAREEREDRERREKEARESEQRRRLEEERRLERQRQVERQREEERLREMEKEAAKQELERQRQEQWERSRKEELSRTREGEHQELSQLRAKKKSLELELEAVGNKHKQISDRLRDAQSKRRIRKAEVELINQKRDARIVEINALQLQFEDWQKKFSLLVPEQQKLTEKLRHMNLNKILPVTLASLAANVSNKGVNCRKLKDQLDALQKETAEKLAQMEQHNKELQLEDMDDCLLRALLSLLACLSQLFLLFKELREKQAKQQSVLDDLRRVKEEKLRELKRRREEEEEERRRRMEEEERRRREEEEQRERRRKEEEERERRRIEEEERERRRKEEEERERRRKEEEEQERRKKEEEEARWAKLEQERIAREEARQWEEEERKKREQERIAREEARQWEEEERKKREEEKRKKAQEEAQAASRVTLYKALYSFAARNKDELSIDADGLIEVDEQTVGEPGWLCGSYRGNKGWFPHSYAEKCAEAGPSSLGPTSCPQLLPVCGVPDGELTGDNGALPLQSETSQLPAPVLTQVMTRRSPTTSTTTSSQINLNLSSSEGEMSADTDPLDGIDSVQLEGKPNPQLFAVRSDLTPPCVVAQNKEYVALYTYESPEAGDLTFEEGDVVVVTEREGEWWRGCIGDQSGIFPSNYVRPVDPEVSRPGGPTKKPEIAQAVTSSAAGAPTIYQLHLSPGQLIVVLAKNSTGWWLGELQVRGKKRQRGWIHSSHVKLLGPSSNKSSPSPLPVCQVIAMYEYTAANPDELSFSKGQLINVLDKTNPDWWKGEADGVTGLLPTNYVKMTTESDPSQQ